jgi:hypothetical protein
MSDDEMAPVEWRDRVFLEMSNRHEIRPMVCGIHLGLDRPPDMPRLRERVAKLIAAFPRLRRRIQARDGIPVWTPAGDFSLDDHLQTPAEPIIESEAELVTKLAMDMRERLDPERSPWRLRVLRTGDQYGLHLQWHHSLCDGEGMLALLGSLSDDAAEPQTERDLRVLDPSLRVDERVEIENGMTARTRAPGLVASVLRARASERRERSVGSDRFRVLPIFATLSPELLARLRAGYGVSTNELLLALASWAVFRHGQRRGRAPSFVRFLSPLGDRGGDQRVLLGNHTRALRLRLDLDGAKTVPQLIARVRAVSRDELRRGRAAPYGLYRLLFSLPPRLRDRLLSAVPPQFVNYLPWAATPRWIAGARVERLHGFTPMLPFHGCTFAVTSYQGALHGNLVCDTELLADPELMVACLDEAVVLASGTSGTRG